MGALTGLLTAIVSPAALPPGTNLVWLPLAEYSNAVPFYLPNGTNPPTRTNDPKPWEQFSAVNNNWVWTTNQLAARWISGTAGNGVNLTNLQGSHVTGLTDNATNSVLNSPRHVAWASNTVVVPWHGTNYLPAVTNWAGLAWSNVPNDLNIYGSPIYDSLGNPTNKLGVVSMFFSHDNVTWTQIAPPPTNGVVWVRAVSEPPPEVLSQPVNTILSNVVAWALDRPDLCGRTNATWGEHLHVSAPLDYDDAAPWGSVVSLYNGLQTWRADRRVELQGNALGLTAEWSLSTSATPAQRQAILSYLGEGLLTATAAAPTNAPAAAIALVDTNLVISVPTNGLFGVPRLEFSTSVERPVWVYLTNSATVIGTNYIFTLPVSLVGGGYFLAMQPGSAPGVVTVGGLLALPPRTISYATNTTWGGGAGLVCADGYYLYVSTGTNAWRRVAISAW